MLLLLLAVAQAATSAPTPLPAGTPFGPETAISFASGGGLREWTRGAPDSGVLYVRDRTERWYQVTLTGRCRLDYALDTLSYTTDVNGRLDRFSRLRVASQPYQECGVDGIRRSTPPRDYPQPRRRR